jgi:hypothetical protein
MSRLPLPEFELTKWAAVLMRLLAAGRWGTHGYTKSMLGPLPGIMPQDRDICIEKLEQEETRLWHLQNGALARSGRAT